MDALSIDRADLVANHSGGAIAQLFLARHPQRVRSLLLTNCDSEIDCPPPARDWDFPAPFGRQEVVGLPLSESITLSRHLRAPEIHAYMNLQPLAHLRDPDTPPPTPADASGCSSQRLLVDAVVRKGNEERRARAHGRDIYAVTAPLVVEAVARLLAGSSTTTGVASAGQGVDARDFLGSLEGVDLAVEIE